MLYSKTIKHGNGQSSTKICEPGGEDPCAARSWVKARNSIAKPQREKRRVDKPTSQHRQSVLNSLDYKGGTGLFSNESLANPEIHQSKIRLDGVDGVLNCNYSLSPRHQVSKEANDKIKMRFAHKAFRSSLQNQNAKVTDSGGRNEYLQSVLDEMVLSGSALQSYPSNTKDFQGPDGQYNEQRRSLPGSSRVETTVDAS